MTQWHTQERPNPLREDEVHLWTRPLTTVPEELSYFESILAADEKERARRFRNSSDGEHYIIARGCLRYLLGVYVARAPDRLHFTYDALGKPSLSNQRSKTILNFNVSHSGDQGLFGFTRGRRIGVDLEYVRPDIDALALAKGYFSPDEFRRLRQLPASEQYDAFYSAWTRKEAYLKACGEGLSFGLGRVEVSFSPAEPAMIRNVADVPNVSAAWTLKHLSPAPGYVGAVAVEDRNVTFRFFRLELK